MDESIDQVVLGLRECRGRYVANTLSGELVRVDPLRYEFAGLRADGAELYVRRSYRLEGEWPAYVEVTE